jgi:hypothetical protein
VKTGRRVHTEWYHLHEILEQTTASKSSSVTAWVEGELTRKDIGKVWGDGNVLHGHDGYMYVWQKSNHIPIKLNETKKGLSILLLGLKGKVEGNEELSSPGILVFQSVAEENQGLLWFEHFVPSKTHV